MTASRNTRMDEDRSRKGIGADGSRMTPKAVLAKLAEDAKKDGKA